MTVSPTATLARQRKHRRLIMDAALHSTLNAVDREPAGCTQELALEPPRPEKLHRLLPLRRRHSALSSALGSRQGTRLLSAIRAHAER